MKPRHFWRGLFLRDAITGAQGEQPAIKRRHRCAYAMDQKKPPLLARALSV
jgi:hypothetical protein